MVARKRPLRSGPAVNPAPLVGREYLSMIREYERAEKQRRVEESNQGVSIETPQTPQESPRQSEEPQALPPPELSDDDMDSDEFEDVALDGDDRRDEATPGDVTVSFTKHKHVAVTKTGRPKGEPKELRLAVHKVSLIVWMLHCQTRDAWLRSPRLLRESRLRRLLPMSVTTKLYPPSHLTPFLKSKTFIEGLRAAMQYWQARFVIDGAGLASTVSDKGDPGDYEEYVERLLSLTGSTDMLGQGFVALLRSLRFRVRLVCSLQPPDNLSATETAKRGTFESKCPLFWAEVRDEHVDGWVGVDPLTSTVRLPTKTSVKLPIEPPLNDSANTLRYVLAFEKRGSRDVTRRYASAFNARTRKRRLPYVDGRRFLDSLFARFTPRRYTPEDVVEIKELAKYPLLEGIPTRVQDFVGHPVYALVDGLHKNEVLRPGAKPCGTLALKNKQMTFIYHREDVLTARSEQSWYRRGRKVKIGVPASTFKNSRNRLTGELDKVKLYTSDLTELYRAPPVEADGTVPKSEYHSIDVFTPSMVPEGGVHIDDKLGQKAARILKVDYANAVVGVDFGKQGPRSKVLGVVVAKQYAPAILEVVQGLKDAERSRAAEAEEHRVLQLWRKLIVGIQIWERIETMNPEHDAELLETESEYSGDPESSHSSFSDLDMDDASESE